MSTQPAMTLAEALQVAELVSPMPQVAHQALQTLAKSLAFYRAAFLRQRPQYLPDRVRLHNDVFGDPPFRGAGAAAGEHRCESNAWGAISVTARDGKPLGIKPGEYEPISWKLNPNAAAKQ